MFRETVQVMDAIMALMLTEASMQAESSLFGLDFDLNAPFPQEPMETYKEFEEIVLQKLHLMHLIKDENNCSGYDTLIENYTAFVETQEVSTSENNDGLISQENSTFLNSFSPLAEESETSVNKRKAEDYANEEQITVFNTSRSKKKPKLFEQNQEHGFASCAPNKLFEDTQDFVVQKPCISNINSRDNITSEMNTEENASVKNKAKINKTKNILARFKKTPKIPDEQNATDNNENMDSGQMCTENKQHEEQIKEKCVYTETQQNTEFNYKENNSRGVFEMLPKIPEINCEPDIESKKKLKRKAKKNKALKETDLLNMLPSVADTLNFDDFNFDDDVNIDF